MDFLAEYDEMNAIPPRIAATYLFFDLFRVVLKDSDNDKRGLHWSSISVDSKLSDDALLAFKAYLKAKKSELKKPDTKINCGKSLWFFFQKILELGAFDTETRRDISRYIDLVGYMIS